MASMGQTAAQWPQSMHHSLLTAETFAFDTSRTKLGQTLTQSPQPTHFEAITSGGCTLWFMTFPSCIIELNKKTAVASVPAALAGNNQITTAAGEHYTNNITEREWFVPKQKANEAGDQEASKPDGGRNERDRST